MRQPAPCILCSQEALTPGSLVWTAGELDDVGVIYVECTKAHRSAIVFDAHRYQMLLRSGARALLAGFSSESIATLAAALERAYELYIRVICRRRSIPSDCIDAAWKEVQSQSERQLGAFSFLYLLETNKPLPLDPDIPRLRNKIIHQGRIARDKDARQFGELIFARLLDIEAALQGYPEALRQEREHELQQQISSIPQTMQHATLKIETVLADGNQVTGKVRTFNEFLVATQTSLDKGFA